MHDGLRRSRLFLAVMGVCVGVSAVAAAADAEPAVETQPAPTLASARELWLEGFYDRAAEQYDRLGSDTKTSLPAALGLARCRLVRGDVELALETLDRQAAAARHEPDWHTLRGEVLSSCGRYAEAVTHARRALELDPQAHRARNLLGGLLERSGKRDEAIQTYAFFDRLLTRRMPSTAEGITEAATGFYRYSVLTRHPNLSTRTRHVLQEFLQVAYERVDRHWWPARVAAAELLRSKYNLAQATEDYQAALRINANLPEALLGLGYVALAGWRFEEVDRRVEAVLAVNPNSAAALTLQARCRILERRYDEAQALADRALEINAGDIEALSVAAAAARCRYDAAMAGKYEQRVAGVNPRCATFHAILGDALSGLRQYAEGEAAYLRSIEFEPTDPNPRTELGMLYMQWGREAKARMTLDASWALDPFNERTYNTLELLEKLESFAQFETEHFTILYEDERDWPIAPYVARVAEEIYGEVCADFDVELPQKTIVEIFPTHRDFGVRITGKPWIHTVGACTGWVIALESPRASPQTSGPYHYAQVLRHEFAHTVTLAMTGNRIPHWFTEGLAVLSENTPRSFMWCQLLAEGVRRQRLFSLETINWGFMRPKRPGDRQMAYAQSEWLVEYLIHRFGYDVLGRMLKGFHEAKSQEEVFRTIVGIEPEALDADFARWARTQAEQWGFPLTPPEDVLKLRASALIAGRDAELLGRLARAELDEGNADGAIEAGRRALEMDGCNADALMALVSGLMAKASETESRDQAAEYEREAQEFARRLIKAAPDEWTGPKTLGELALRRGQHDEAIEAFKQLQRICPRDPDSYRGLAGIYLERAQHDEALPQLLELTRMDEHDAEVSAKAASILAARDRLSEARYWYRQSLFVDPYAVSTHTQLAEVLARMGDNAGALAEYEVLCRLEPDQSRHFAQAAFSCRKLGDEERAREFARQAVKLDPGSPAAALLADG